MKKVNWNVEDVLVMSLKASQVTDVKQKMVVSQTLICRVYSSMYDYLYVKGDEDANERKLMKALVHFSVNATFFRPQGTLVEMQVPYAVRRFFYTHCNRLQDLFRCAFNSDGKYLSEIRAEVTTKGGKLPSDATICHAGWEWFYRSFLPFAERYNESGMEERANNVRSEKKGGKHA